MEWIGVILLLVGIIWIFNRMGFHINNNLPVEDLSPVGLHDDDICREIHRPVWEPSRPERNGHSFYWCPICRFYRDEIL